MPASMAPAQYWKEQELEAQGKHPGHSAPSSQAIQRHRLQENICLWPESFTPWAAILIQSFSFQVVEPFWLAACDDRKRYRTVIWTLLPPWGTLDTTRNYKDCIFPKLLLVERCFESPILTLQSTQPTSLIAGMEHMKVALHCPLTAAGMRLLTRKTTAYEQDEIWALICSSFVSYSEHIFSWNQLVVRG